MNKRIVLFNIVYYLVLFLLISAGRKDPSSSLGYGFFILIFWVIAGVLLAVFLFRNILQPSSVLDYIGIFMATPIMTMIVIGFLVGIN